MKGKSKKKKSRSLVVLSLSPQRGENNGVMKDCGRWMDGSSSLHVERARVGTLHAVAEAWLSRWLTVPRRCLVAIAIRLLRGHGYAGTCRQHQLWCSCSTQTRGRFET